MSDVVIRPMAGLPQVDVRFDPSDAGLVERLAAAMVAAPPIAPNTTAAAADGQGHWLWLGPDEWLIVGREGDGEDVAPAVEAALRAAGGDAFLTTVDVSANRVGIEVRGPDARRLLGFGCSLDLDRLVVGTVAQTMVARANVVLWPVADDPAPAFVLLVRPSFAAYLEMWLRDAEVGLG